VSDIGEGTGIFGQVARLDLVVEGGDGTAPPSVVAKMACTEPANLEVATMLGLYTREIKMFEHVLDETPIRTPICHAAVEQDYAGPGVRWPDPYVAGRRRPQLGRTDGPRPRLELLREPAAGRIRHTRWRPVSAGEERKAG